MGEGREEARPLATGAFPIVGIGASAGGLEAFGELLRHLAPDTGMGFVLVQHLAPAHASMLCSILSRTTSMPVREVTERTAVERDHVYVIPPNSNLAATAFWPPDSRNTAPCLEKWWANFSMAILAPWIPSIPA
jgi:chemotaxis response regulator CheB